MTVSTSVYKAGPYAGSGTTGPFTVNFRFLANSHLRVIKTSTTGSEATLILGVDYSVTGAGGASGTVTLTSPLLTGEKLTIVRNVQLTQETDYVFDDSFPAESHEQALDKLTMITQQLAEEVDRAVKVLPSSNDDPDALIASVKTSEQNAAASAASAAASYDLFDDRYLGSKTSDPTVDNDGNALQVGAEYWNSVSNERRTWTGSAWVSSITVVPDASVTTAKLADASVTTAKLADGAVTTAKLASSNGQLAGMRNRIINGGMMIDQRNLGAAQTITGGASPLAYSLDRWQVRSTGANATVQQVTVSGQRRMRFTGAASVTAVAAHQRIEASNSADLAGRSVTLSLKASSSSLTTLTLEIYGANSTDSFGTWASPTVTLVSSQTVNISTTETTVSINTTITGSIFSGLEVRITGGALGAGQTLTIGDVQLEPGSVATPFEHRPFGAELALCQRYFEVAYFDVSGYMFVSTARSAFTDQWAWYYYQVAKRALPTVTMVGGSWVNVTPGVNSGLSWTYTQSSSGTFFRSGSAGTIAATFSSEL